MYKFKKILVALDNSSMDEKLISAASYICERSDSTDVFFTNIIKDFEVPSQLEKQFPELLENALKDRKEEMAKKVKEFFIPETAKTHINVKKGHILKDLLLFAEKEGIDLIVVGRKNKKDGGILNTRLARRATCSLLIVPQDAKIQSDKILVPIDFSDNSQMALEKAVDIANFTDAKIITQNVYQVPVGYHYSGKSFDEFSKVMENNARDDFKKFVKKIKLADADIEQMYTLVKEEDNIMIDVYKTAIDVEADIMIVGAKGRTAATALFIGSKSEKLVQINEKIPLLVVRPKGKNAGIIDLLREL
ncbi:MAG: universal stress protein [bacterium]|nr:universal stress protein [bacterium]